MKCHIHMHKLLNFRSDISIFIYSSFFETNSHVAQVDPVFPT